MRSTCGDRPDGVPWTKFGQFGPSYDHFRGQKAIFKTIWGLKTACFAHESALWGLPGGLKGPKMGQSDTYLANISHLIHYVVFGNKFGAIQDFQRGKNSSPADPS